MRGTFRAAFVLGALLLACGCSIKKIAVRKLGESLTGSTSTFTSDNDPALIREAAPFSLKMIEGLIEQDPKNTGLLLTAARGFTEYSYAFVQTDADELEDKDRAGAAAKRSEAAKLYVRARDYGMRAIETKHPGFAAKLKANPGSAAKELGLKEVPQMFWTAAPWAGVLVATHDMFMLPQIPQFEALIDRALELQPDYDEGGLQTFMITYEMASPTRKGDKAAIAKGYFDRALEISHGHQAGAYLAYAESVLQPARDRAGFDTMLKKALAVDVNAEPSHRLLNVVMQQRARWLLAREDKLFPPSQPKQGY